MPKKFFFSPINSLFLFSLSLSLSLDISPFQVKQRVGFKNHHHLNLLHSFTHSLLTTSQKEHSPSILSLALPNVPFIHISSIGSCGVLSWPEGAQAWQPQPAIIKTGTGLRACPQQKVRETMRKWIEKKKCGKQNYE